VEIPMAGEVLPPEPLGPCCPSAGSVPGNAQPARKINSGTGGKQLFGYLKRASPCAGLLRHKEIRGTSTSHKSTQK
jgi:hypothetical protein